MTQKERLVQLIIDSVNGCARNWAEVIADHLLANGVLVIDTDVVSMKNRPLISSVASLPIDEVIDLVKAKEEGRLIVPPCKVGDTVYIVDGTTDGIVEGKITHFEFNIYTTPREWITVRGNYPLFGELEEKNRIDLLIGKTVFLTREEAEKALKERNNENQK